MAGWHRMDGWLVGWRLSTYIMKLFFFLYEAFGLLVSL